MKKICLLFSLVWVLFPTGYSQILGLQDYRQRVIDYNQDIKQSRAVAEAALYALKRVKTGFFPQLDFSGSYSYQFERVEFIEGIRLKHDNYNAEAGLVQNVYAGGAVRKQYEMAQVQQAIAVLG
ncbi:MAG: TolC family protein, partial [Odoribacter sp.]|nr:TolC family protein [Odoribacter sp.]